MKKIYGFLTLILAFVQSSNGLSASDHVFYYIGKVHYTDLIGSSHNPPDQEFILKKELLPSRGVVVETATMHDRSGVMSDLTTTVKVSGSSVVAISTDGSVTGVGRIEGPEWDFTYLEINFVVGETGTRVKNINYITPTKLIARKEISNSSGKPTMLWEADMNLMTEDAYLAKHQEMMGR